MNDRVIGPRVALVAALAIGLAVVAAAVAQGLGLLIAAITNLAFFGRWSIAAASPADHELGPAVVLIPVVGALVIGVMARYGSAAIRGHGIPEAMEQILLHESRIPARMTVLKPLSAAISIGTGGPFGAEGPIIATGGALGSLLGQLLPVTADERRTLLAAGAAAGMSATFGSPVSAVLLAIELLLFEYAPASLIPVALAAAVADACRIAVLGTDPMFAMPAIGPTGGAALATYVALGLVVGAVAVAVSRSIYAIEDAFARLPIHWMWWPALGAVAVGIVGWIEPRTFGVGYDNIAHALDGSLAGTALAMVCALKFVSWSIALGSGTSGGTLAPLLTLGGGLGGLLGATAAAWLPTAGVDVRVAALVGMAAMFTGAARAMLASVVFAFETTGHMLGLMPVLAGCGGAYLVSCLTARESIMTEKLARRGTRVVSEYRVDWLARTSVGDCCTRDVVTLATTDAVAGIRAWLAGDDPHAKHPSFVVVDRDGRLVGVVTARELALAPTDATIGALVHRAPIAIALDDSARDAADAMVRHAIGRLPVVLPDDSTRVVGIVTRGDLLRAHALRLAAATRD